MATFNTIWSIDLGKSSLKAVKIRRERNNVEILAVDKIDYPIGTNGVDAVQHAREALSAFKLRNDVREPLVVAHPGQGTFSRFIKVPAFEAKKLKEMVGYEASQQIPFPLDEVIWDYHLIAREYMSGEEREVGIFAVRREAIDDYLLDFTSEGLSVEMLSIGFLGLLNYVFFDIAPSEPSIILDIGATHTDLILVDGKRFWIRAVPHSGNDINKAIMARFKVSFQEAEKLKIESAKVPKQAMKIFSAVIQPKLKELVGEIHRSVGYYRSQAGEVKFQNLYLLGNGSRVLGIKRYLAEQLGVQVHRVSALRHFRINRDVDLKLLQSQLPAFGTAFGGALQGVGAGNCKVDLVPQEERIQKELGRKKKHAFIAMAIIYLMIVLAYLILDGKIENGADAARKHKSYIKKEIAAFTFTPGSDEDPTELKKQADELIAVAEIRSLALRSLRGLGAVIPGVNAESEIQTVEATKEIDTVTEIKQKMAALNDTKVWIPWVIVKRIDWPEEDGNGPGRRRNDSRPTVPAYKVRVGAAVVMQDNVDASMALIRRNLEVPLERFLKEQELTIDPDVRLSVEYEENIMQLPQFRPRDKNRRGGSRSTGGRRKKDSDETPQEAGPFFGVELFWILRLKDPPVPEPPEPESTERK